MPNYNIGQIVRVDIPSTYGKIVAFSRDYMALGGPRRPREEYPIIGVVVEYMKPFLSLGSPDKEVNQSEYMFDHPVFGKAFHVVNPVEEARALRAEKAGRLPNHDPASKRRIYTLDEAISYLETPKK